MADDQRKRGAIKLIFWGVLALLLVGYCAYEYTSGRMIEWYYYKAKSDGYAVNANSFLAATKEKPMTLEIGKFDPIQGLQAVAVKRVTGCPSTPPASSARKTSRKANASSLRATSSS